MRWRERRLKRDNVMSGFCHDFTHLCGDKVMNVNDTCLLDVQNAGRIKEHFFLVLAVYYKVTVLFRVDWFINH